jgi:hypothetical protein
MGPTALRRALLLLAALVGGLAMGAALSALPSSDSAKIFWVSNLAAPWLALAFVAGWPQRGRAWGAIAGAAAALACVLGFYAHLLWFVRILFHHTGGSFAWEPADKSIIGALPPWLSSISPWLGLALVFGALFGFLGARWGASRWLVAGLCLALAFLLEPVGWLVVHGGFWPPYVVWIAEAAVGAALLAAVLLVQRSRARLQAQVASSTASSGATQQAHRSDTSNGFRSNV